MPPTHAKPLARTCHWEDIQGARVKGRVMTSRVWVCEYPYRTMRRHGPGEECSDCPVWHEMQLEKERAHRDQDETTPVHPLV